MSVFDGEEDLAAEEAGRLHDPATREQPPRPWQVGDRVRVVDGPRLLLGATGMVLEVDLPGAWSVRVHIDRRGFDRARLAPHELRPADQPTDPPADQVTP
ncbi:KOW motif-containing protein [Myceligenerans pegani]|uniref:KOW motif-containing protein n=1 Tax=Myceligenerans pegani TaxID=2776917 RepID=A0ABR9N511_9MICO|nr:KOW motif-containing protein [Myceligenerans sp. TRM 65318]MBE1878763.1 KOW motif-containing protein [Myceligenerans sp. TRM 65318]MBE3021034.1 KOW motif-containing protein [Myceligenerans sp. TRM 65318]